MSNQFPKQTELAIDGLHKIITFGDIGPIADKARAEGKQIVHSHGIFDLLHPGHIDHLQQARALGDLLFVSVTSDRESRRGPGRPVFFEDLRMRSLAALECVDYVVLSDHTSALPVIEVLSPDVFVKGREYADPTRVPSERFAAESARVQELGGALRFIGGMLYSSTRLLNDYFGALPPAARAFAIGFRERWDSSAVREAVRALRDLKVLVVGEVIIDEYITCEVLGVTPKERIPSLKSLVSHRHWGGAYAIARHLASCCGSVTLASMVGPDDELLATAGAHHATSVPSESGPITLNLVADPGAKTVVKQRYVIENTLREEITKVFAVGHLPEPALISASSRSQLRDRLRAMIDGVDLVVVSDFGHGLFDQETMDFLQDYSPRLALNCQSNSANWGFNPITKYRRADSFCLDSHELSLAFRVRPDDPQLLLQQLREHLGSAKGWLTLGAGGALGCDNTGAVHSIPALTLQVRDTLGAGDAFFAWASVAAATGQPLEFGSFLGSLAGALAANVIGNERAVGTDDVLRLASLTIDA